MVGVFVTSMQSLAELKEAVQEHLESHDTLESFPLYAYKGLDWEKHKKFCEDGYSRLVLEHTNAFDIVLVCWKHGDKTPKHDHPSQGCVVRMLRGELEETRFASEETTSTFSEGKTTYIHNDLGFHKFRNVSGGHAVSLHIYAPGGYQPRLVP